MAKIDTAEGDAVIRT